MAVDLNGLKLLLWAKNLGVSFERTLTLGHQGFGCSPRQFRAALRAFGIAAGEKQIDLCYHRAPMGPLFADELFRFLGAKEVVSVDYSDFEDATFLHDLNEPFPPDHQGRYSFVFDGGTLEHVFNYPAALRHCLEAIRAKGHFLSIAPAHNQMGHGFYQISPELFFRVFSAENGFALRRIVLYDAAQEDAEFFHVNDPATTGQRSELLSAQPMFLAALAQRIALTPVLAKTPQQSDYMAGWTEHGKKTESSAPAFDGFLGRLRTRLNPYWPYWLRRWKQKLIFSFQHRRPTLNNRLHFRKLSRTEICQDRGDS